MPDLDLDLNVDIRDVETTMPRLQTGQYRFKIGELEVNENKAKTGRNLTVQFILDENALTTKGKPANPGLLVFRHYPLQQSTNPKAPDFRRDLVALIDAALNITDPNQRPTLSEGINSLQGRTVIGHVIVEDDPKYGETNSINKVEPCVG